MWTLGGRQRASAKEATWTGAEQGLKLLVLKTTVMWSLAKHQLQSPELDGAGRTLLTGSTALHVPCLWPSETDYCKRINVCLVKLPSSWSLVTAASGPQGTEAGRSGPACHGILGGPQQDSSPDSSAPKPLSCPSQPPGRAERTAGPRTVECRCSLVLSQSTRLSPVVSHLILMRKLRLGEAKWFFPQWGLFYGREGQAKFQSPMGVLMEV